MILQSTLRLDTGTVPFSSTKMMSTRLLPSDNDGSWGWKVPTSFVKVITANVALPSPKLLPKIFIAAPGGRLTEVPWDSIRIPVVFMVSTVGRVATHRTVPPELLMVLGPPPRTTGVLVINTFR